MKKAIRIVGIVLGSLILIAAAYIVYVFASWKRIPDNTPVEINGSAEETAVSVGKELKVLTFNIGFGAYEPDFSFFMDGGHESWAFSKERLTANLENIRTYLDGEDADFTLIQEVDTNSTRTYHVDETEILLDGVRGNWNWTQNYNSPFLMYPLYQPHGRSVSGMVTVSKAEITSTVRISLPVEEGFSKFLDLDRCYAKNYLNTDDGKQLVLYNVHLSAYTSDGSIAERQLEILVSDMQAEYEKGNYCIAGGDLNKDVSGDYSLYFGGSAEEENWAQPIPEETFDNTNLRLIFAYDEETKTPSCRNADGPLTDEQFKLTVDGFIVSDNVQVETAEVVDTGFRYSDHNPVKMTIILEE